MLVQFMFKNVLSFKDETILDMTAVNAYKEHPCNLITQSAEENILKVAAIYGANASGKSNLYSALCIFRKIVSESLNNVAVENGETTVIKEYYLPFLFDENKEDSEFGIVQILDDTEYTYGFTYNAERIVSEWLYSKSLKTKRQSKIFERTMDGIEFGSKVRRICDVFKDQIPTETLALTFFNKLKLKSPIFNTVYSGIMDIWIASDNFEDIRLLEEFLPLIIDGTKEKFLKFLSAIDTGIKNISYEKSEKGMVFTTYHSGKENTFYPLNLYNESAGTIKSIMLYIVMNSVIMLGKSVMIDEINTRLHPLLQKFIIDLFYEEESKAQLIYTTHDTTLMDKKFFRRDQIWFVQKDEYGYSSLYALSDFKVRSDASFEKDYLAGVYGGIPLLKEFSLKEEA